jgi:signal transduction histidine kinase
MNDSVFEVPLRVRSHVLRLLGDQLVGHDRLAIFELVKNAYDADAKSVSVVLDLMKKNIAVRDDGHGMTADVVKQKWLDIGTDSKRGPSRVRSPLFGRMPLGEKGVGRLAVQKLGAKLQMVTRAAFSPEIHVELAWADLIDSSPFVDGKLIVRVVEKAVPTVFNEDTTGTLIEISELARSEWTRRDLRDLKRLVVSLESPFEAIDSFKVALQVPGRERDIDEVPDLEELLKRAIWFYEFDISEKGFSWSYRFTPPRLKGLKARTLESEGYELLETSDEARKEAKSHAKSADEVQLFVDTTKALKGIGPIRGRFYVFYRRDEILRLLGDPRQTKQWLKDQAGVRIFRDGIRVYNYGEADDDWLNLNTRRINRPTAKLGTDQVIGAIALQLETSSGLHEKTNREGFTQNEEFGVLRQLVLSATEHLEKLHDSDRRSIDQALRGEETQVGSTVKLRDAIAGLKVVCNRDTELGKALTPLVDVIEREVEQVQSVMLNAAMAGMGLALVYHEIDRSIRTLTALAEKGVPADRLRSGLSDLRKMLDSISVLLKQGKARKLSIRSIVQQAMDLNEARLAFHGIVLSAPVITGENPEFFVNAPQHLVLSALNNIIDNAIYWSGHKFRQDPEGSSKPAIGLLTSWSESEGGALTVVDNGGGFALSAADAMQPFVTQRTGGMGLGLYYCRLVMENIGGSLGLGTAEDASDFVEIPPAFTGAAVTMRFSKEGENE